MVRTDEALHVVDCAIRDAEGWTEQIDRRLDDRETPPNTRDWNLGAMRVNAIRLKDLRTIRRALMDEDEPPVIVCSGCARLPAAGLFRKTVPDERMFVTPLCAQCATRVTVVTADYVADVPEVVPVKKRSLRVDNLEDGPITSRATASTIERRG